MKKQFVGMLALSALGLFVLTAMSQPPEGRGPGKKGPPPPFEPGKILPPHVRDMLELSEDQENQIRDLEKEVRAKLLRILTGEQKERLKELRDKGPKGPPRDGDFPPEKGKGKGKDKGKDKDNPRERPDYEETKWDLHRYISAWTGSGDCSGSRRQQ